MDQHDLERIARTTLKELGMMAPDLAVSPMLGRPGVWRIEIRGNTMGPTSITVRCGHGSTAGWVREQIFEQLT